MRKIFWLLGVGAAGLGAYFLFFKKNKFVEYIEKNFVDFGQFIPTPISYTVGITEKDKMDAIKAILKKSGADLLPDEVAMEVIPMPMNMLNIRFVAKLGK